MSITDFDYLKVTTMTVIVELEGTVFIENAFPLLEITRLELPKRLRQTKKFKIPYCGIPGAILAVTFENTTRGIVKNKSGKFFRNSITIDICTSKKNISAKLSRGKIHLCGPNSEALSRETAEHIIDHLIKIQSDLDYMKDKPEEKENSIKWLKEASKGDHYIIDADTHEIIELKDREEIQTMYNGILSTGDSVDSANESDSSLSSSVPDTREGLPVRAGVGVGGEEETCLKVEEGQEEIVERVIVTDGTVKTKRIEFILSKWNEGDNIGNDGTVMNKEGVPYKMLLDNDKVVTCILERNFFIKPDKCDDRGNIISHSFTNMYGEPVRIVQDIPLKVLEVDSLVIPTGYPNNYPVDVDQRIANFYIKHAPDHVYHHVFCQFVDFVSGIEEVITPGLRLKNINMAMINYSYSLGMCINRWNLANRINGNSGFLARYNNTTDHCVTISLPYEVPEHMREVRRKNKPPCHTFMVYKSGIVTQSGPNIDMMRDAYNKFMGTITEIRSDIIQKDKSFSLKYVPSY